ncbi:mitogen-activated protein kinase associated protein, putative, partial [Ixodes scapularis]
MAFFDDRRFLLSHVRHSFVTCDDTGMCELAMLNEAEPRPWEPPLLLCGDGPPPTQDQPEMGQSYDIVSDMELIGAHRRRSNTAQRLERLKKERRQQAKLRHVVWRESPSKTLSRESLPGPGDCASSYLPAGESSGLIERGGNYGPKEEPFGGSGVADEWRQLGNGTRRHPSPAEAINKAGDGAAAPVSSTDAPPCRTGLRAASPVRAACRTPEHTAETRATLLPGELLGPVEHFRASELEALFPRKDPLRSSGRSRDVPDVATARRSSALARQLDQFPVAPNNPFNEYTRFDGKVSEQGHRCISVFLSVQPVEERRYPLVVATLPGARIQDLIGLVCWHYTNEGRSPKLRPSVSHYCLRIAEESGEIDEDFPPLDPREPVSKFEFPFLALAQLDREDFPTGTLLTFHTKDGFSKVQIPSLDATLREVLDQMLKRRKGLLRSLGPEFHVENHKEVGIPIDLDTTIRSS